MDEGALDRAPGFPPLFFAFQYLAMEPMQRHESQDTRWEICIHRHSLQWIMGKSIVIAHCTTQSVLRRDARPPS